MFAAERLKIIKQYLQANEQLEVTAVSSMLGVSEVTIRRDLERLEQEGFLVRTHGGALLKNTGIAEQTSFSTSPAPLSAEELEIIRTALSLILPNDVILLTGAHLTRRMATDLASAKLPLTVLTNDLPIAYSLRGCPQIKTVLLGGQLTEEGSAYGVLTHANATQFFVNKLFFEADALNTSLIMTAASTEKAEFIQNVLSIAEEKIVLCPSDRLDKSAFSRIGPLSLLTTVITDTAMSEEYKELIFKKNLRLYISIDLYEFGRTDSVPPRRGVN